MKGLTYEHEYLLLESPVRPFFLSTSHSDAFYQGWSKLAFRDLGEKAKNKFSRLRQLRPSSIPDQNDFSYSDLSTSHPDGSYQVSRQLAFRFGERSEK